MGKFKVLEVKKQVDPGLADKLEEARKEIEKRLKIPFDYNKLIQSSQDEEITQLEFDVIKIIEEFIKNDNSHIKTSSEETPFVIGKKREIVIRHSSNSSDRNDSFKYYFDKNVELMNDIINGIKTKYETHREDVVKEVLKKFKLSEYIDDPIFKNLIIYTANDFCKYAKKLVPRGYFVATLKFSKLKPTTLKFTTRYDNEGINKTYPEGHIDNDIREATPILLAYAALPNIKFNYQDLGLTEKQADAIMKTYREKAEGKDRKSASLAYMQSIQIIEMLEKNKEFTIIRGGKNRLFYGLKKKGLELYADMKPDEKISQPDNYNPSDFFLIKKSKKLVADAKFLYEYNKLFSNDLINEGGNIQGIGPKFPYAGVSQKQSEKAGGGRAGEYFNVVKAKAFGEINVPKKLGIKEIKKETDNLLNVLDNARDFIEIDKTYFTSFLIESDNEKEIRAKYKIIRSIYNVCTEGGKTPKEIKEEYFENLVKFSIAMVKGLNPCYYKLIGGEISIMNPEVMNVSLDSGDKIIIQFSQNGKYMILYIPIIFYITGVKSEYNEHYKLKLPFEVTGEKFDPIVRGLNSATKAKQKDIAKGEIKKSSQHLLAIGIEQSKIDELDRLWMGEMPKTWFREYRKVIYGWALEVIDKGKIPIIPETKDKIRKIKNQMQQELKNIKLGEEVMSQADIQYKSIMADFRGIEGVEFDPKTMKYVFTESAHPEQMKIYEFLQKL